MSDLEITSILNRLDEYLNHKSNELDRIIEEEQRITNDINLDDEIKFQLLNELNKKIKIIKEEVNLLSESPLEEKEVPNTKERELVDLDNLTPAMDRRPKRLDYEEVKKSSFPFTITFANRISINPEGNELTLHNVRVFIVEQYYYTISMNVDLNVGLELHEFYPFVVKEEIKEISPEDMEIDYYSPLQLPEDFTVSMLLAILLYLYYHAVGKEQKKFFHKLESTIIEKVYLNPSMIKNS